MPTDLSEKIPAFAADYKDATRSAGGTVLNAVAKAMPQVITGSADLFGSTKNYIKDGGDFSKANPLGRNIWFGIREHAMGAICNGIAYDGIFRASGATFLVFADYLRGSIRLAALSGSAVTYIFTHDSVGVGEDGPTHQPVETVSGLRVIPNLDVIRPGDAEETAGAFVAAMSRTDGPTALILTRQAIPLMNELSVEARRDGALKGGYIAKKETGALTTILLASGSELQHAMAAAAELGDGVRVVSHALLRTLRPPERRLPRKRAAVRLHQAHRHRSRRHRPLVEIRRHRRQGPRHRPLRHERPRRHRDEGTRHDQGPRHRRREVTASIQR